MIETARNLRIADLLNLQPGHVLRLHRIYDRPVFASSFDHFLDGEALVAQIAPGRSRVLQGNLQKILDCSVETQVVIRRENGRIVQIYLLDPRSWKQVVAQEGAEVELRIGGRIFAHGRVVGGDEPGIRISSLVERRQ